MTSISSNVSPLCSVRISVALAPVIVPEAVLAHIGGQVVSGCPAAPCIADHACVFVSCIHLYQLCRNHATRFPSESRVTMNAGLCPAPLTPWSPSGCPDCGTAR